MLFIVIHIFRKNDFVITLKDKNGITFINAFQKVLGDSGCKPKKIWVDKVSEFYNISLKFWLNGYDIKRYSTHNDEKSIVAERFIRTLKNKIYKYITSILRNVFINKFADIFNKYCKTYHSTLKMSTYIDSDKKNYKADSNFNVGKHVKISTYKNFL